MPAAGMQEEAARQLPQALHVTREDARELLQLAESLAAKCLDELELSDQAIYSSGSSHHRHHSNNDEEEGEHNDDEDAQWREDATRWRELRQLEGVRIYEELRGADGSAPALPSLLLRGTVPGGMHDMLFAHAAACATDGAMRLRSHYVQDGVLASRVLAELARPSADAPFQRAAVTWRLFPTRDYVCLDATGVLRLPRGQRVGYSLSHSVAFDAQLPRFDKLSVDRGNVSVCSLFRERRARTGAGNASGRALECFARGFFDIDTAGDRVAGDLALRLVSNQWLSFARHMQFAQMKKLAWFLRRSLELRLDGVSDHAGGFHSDAPSASPRKARAGGGKAQCCVCDKGLGLLGGRRRHCRRCDRAVCSGCQVKSRLCWLSPDHAGVTDAREVFCSRCVLEAVQSDALAIAQEEIRRGPTYAGGDRGGRRGSDVLPYSLSWSTAQSSDESDG